MPSKWEFEGEAFERAVVGALRREVFADSLPNNEGMRMCWRLRGRLALGELIVLTGWQSAKETVSSHSRFTRWKVGHPPLAASLVMHCLEEPPVFKGTEAVVFTSGCEALGGAPCWSVDSSILLAQEILNKLIDGGSEALWAALDEWYVRALEASFSG